MMLWFTWFYQTVTGFLDWLFSELLPFLFAHMRNLVAMLWNLISLVAGGAISGVSGTLSNLYSMLELILSALWLALSSLSLNLLWDFVGLLFIIAKLFNILFLYLGLLQNYLVVALLKVTGLIAAYVNAPPIAPPGLPDCVATPLDSNVCAVYYIAENTLLAGTIGSLLIPTVIISVDIFILFYFVNIVRGFVLWFLRALQ